MKFKIDDKVRLHVVKNVNDGCELHSSWENEIGTIVPQAKYGLQRHYGVQPNKEGYGILNMWEQELELVELTEPTSAMHDSGKPTNPKDALGIKKIPLHCIPSAPLLELGLSMMEGGRKYGTHNYRAIGVRFSTYFDAATRHIIDWWEGEDIDPDSGVHHIAKAIASLVVLRDSMFMENYEDDRPVKYPNGLNMDEFNKQAEKLIEKYPDCVKPFLEHEKS